MSSLILTSSLCEADEFVVSTSMLASVSGFESTASGVIDFPTTGEATREPDTFGSLFAVRAALRRLSASSPAIRCSSS